MGALDGLRVLDATIIVAGPQASQLLADLGADVIKIELTNFGDQARWLPISSDDGRSAFFVACNRGKRAMTLDLRVPEGRDVFLRLAETADVVVTNFKPGTMDEWGLGYDELSARNPRLVVANSSAFGPEGPSAAREGADLSGQSAGGLISTTGRDGTEPTPIGAAVCDHMASQNLVAGILAALYARERSGRGQRVDVSLLGSAVWAQASELTRYFLTGAPPGRANRGNPMVPGLYGIVPTKDGWLAVVGVVGAQRPRFFEAIGRPDLSDDPRFAALLYDEPTKAALFAILDEVFAARTTDEWCEVLAAAGQRFAPVRGYADLVADPQLRVNGYVVDVDHDEWGRVTMPGCPIQLSDTPAVPGERAPELGEHTEEVLLEAGYSWGEIAALRDAGAI